MKRIRKKLSNLVGLPTFDVSSVSPRNRISPYASVGPSFLVRFSFSFGLHSSIENFFGFSLASSACSS